MITPGGGSTTVAAPNRPTLATLAAQHRTWQAAHFTPLPLSLPLLPSTSPSGG